MSNLLLDLFFLTTLGQGAMRKWVAPGLSLEIQFFRDMLPVLALIISYQQAHIRRQLGRFTGLAAILFWGYASVSALETWISGLPLFVILVGIRTHFAYLPLAFLMPTYLRSWRHGLRKFRQLLILAVPIFLLGLFQSTQPVDSDWNRYADPEMAVATFSAVDDVRASGTFAYITEFASFAEICALIAVFLMLTTESKIIGRLWNAGILIMAFGAIMASGSRGPAAVFGAQVLGIVALGFGARAIPMRRLLPIVALTVVAVAASVTVLDRQATDFLLRTQTVGTEDIGWRVYGAFFEWFDVMYQYPLGMGLGAGHQAFYAEIPGNIWEAELSRLAFELGLGVLLYIGFKVTLIGQLLAGVKAMRTRAGRTTLATCAVTLIPLIVTGSVYEPLTNAAFWAFVGIGFWVVKLEAATSRALPAAASKFAGTDAAARPGSLVGEGAR
jgi:hypothetical protein